MLRISHKNFLKIWKQFSTIKLVFNQKMSRCRVYTVCAFPHIVYRTTVTKWLSEKGLNFISRVYKIIATLIGVKHISTRLCLLIRLEVWQIYDIYVYSTYTWFILQVSHIAELICDQLCYWEIDYINGNYSSVFYLLYITLTVICSYRF